MSQKSTKREQQTGRGTEGEKRERGKMEGESERDPWVEEGEELFAF
jgi:hypothetical protein